jgi:hypothetical protein
VFVDTLDPAFPDHVSLNVPCTGEDTCGEATWYDVGAGPFVMKWRRET